MAKFVRWLHLSDFHVGMDSYAQRRLFEHICDHVESRIRNIYVPDFIFVTGDLANKGELSEYTDFYENFFYPILDRLGSSWSGKIFAVPGNHDVQRGRASYFSPKDILIKPGSIFDKTAAGKIAREQFALRFQHYSEMDLTGSPRGWLDSEAGTYSV
jgi:3',5'-cyclic AMP phosphodiesterase CpdA